MAELTLTEEEKIAATYLEWSDDALGKLVKKTAKMIQDKYGQESAYITTAATLLVCQAYENNATDATITLDGVTNPEEIGDWEITIRKINK